MTPLTDQERLFQAYLAMGPGRSHAKLQRMIAENPEQYGLAYVPSVRNIREWSSRGDWTSRIRDPANLARQQAEAQRLERIRERRERLYRTGLELQDRGLESLRGAPGNELRLKDAVDTIETGLWWEALSLVSPDDKPPEIALSEEQLTRLSDDDVNRLIQLLEKAVGGRPQKPVKWPKTKLLPWQYDYQKMRYMTIPQKEAYRRRVEAERRALGMAP